MKSSLYPKIAQAVRENTIPGMRGLIEGDTFIEALADILAADNKRFDKAKFLEMCK